MNTNKIEIKCKKCNNLYLTSEYNEHYKKYKGFCKVCAYNNRKSKEFTKNLLICKRCKCNTDTLSKSKLCKSCVYNSHKRKNKHKKRLKISKRLAIQKVKKESKFDKLQFKNRLKKFKKIKNIVEEVLYFNEGKNIVIYKTKCCSKVHKNTIESVAGKKATCGYCNMSTGYYSNEELHQEYSITAIKKWSYYKDDLTLICNCGNIYKTKINKIKNSRELYCKKCRKNRSIGELKIRENLLQYNIKFKEEEKFNGLVSEKGYPLRFDFYIPSSNICIEYDGEQHFQEIVFYKNHNTDLDKIKQNDQLKNDFCRENNITLVRIPYWDINNIEEILNEYRIK